MKAKLIITSFLTAAISAYGATISGTAATGVTGLNGGDSTFFVIDIAGDGFDYDGAAGVTFSVGSTIGDDLITTHNAVVSSFGSTSINGSANVTFGTDGIASGQDFYIIAFSGNSATSVTTVAGANYNVASGANWSLPTSNGDTISYGADIVQLSSFNGSALTVVPEASSFALIAGSLALTGVMLRRRV